MPFIHVFDFDDQQRTRAGVVSKTTEAVVARLEIEPSSVTFYFSSLAPKDFGQSGLYGEAVPYRRLFVHFHSYARSDDVKRSLAASLTRILSEHYAMPAEHVAIYFFDRSQNEVAHGGSLACDA